MSTEAKYEELCEMIRGSSPNWTHEETLDRCAQQVDALNDFENKDEVEMEEEYEDATPSNEALALGFKVLRSINIAVLENPKASFESKAIARSALLTFARCTDKQVEEK
jgi:hypothetical protein